MGIYKNIDKSSNFSTVRGQRVNFSAEDINGIYNFLNVNDQTTFRLRPSTGSTIHVKRLVLNHVLYSKMTWNIGNIISKNIKYCRSEKHRKNSIWFPSTITSLVIEAELYQILESRYPRLTQSESHKVINRTFFDNMKKTKGSNKKSGEDEPMLKKRPRAEKRPHKMEVLGQSLEHIKVIIRKM
ncbi:hypothetical protein HAX54_033424 [Datura stramonium]|uniref:Uncharacterized protein n=1 Tax=Datura stramonium TaxID=4076 RepID=A0ABS8VDV7_DATST|nr:hypothetical protein [Datura stramonium]